MQGHKDTKKNEGQLSRVHMVEAHNLKKGKHPKHDQLNPY